MSAGLQAARSDAMKRARERAEEMRRNGEFAKPVLPPSVATSPPVATSPAKAPATSSSISPPVKTKLANAAPAAKKPTPPAPPPRAGIKFAETIERRESVNLNQDEEALLNKAILTMFLEDQAPEQLDKADKLLDKYHDNVDALFDNLSSGNDIEALMQSEDVTTPAWNRFAASRKQRQSAKGFFGTGSASPLAFVHEEHVKVKSRGSFSAKKKRGSDPDGKTLVGGLMSRVLSVRAVKV